MTEFIQGRHHLWNHFDDLGALIGMKRQIGEQNREFRLRILDAYQHPGNSTHQGMVNAISRDLAYPVYNVIDRTIFLLDEQPRSDRLVQVTVDGVVQTPQLIDTFPLPTGWLAPVDVTPAADLAFDADPAPTEGWILWKDSEGSYTRVLEFVNAPPSESSVQITYYFDVDGHIHQRTNREFTVLEQDPIYDVEGRFTGFRSYVPSSGDIHVNALNNPDFRDLPANGLKDSKGRATALLIAIADRINAESPLLWNEFLWDETYWDSASKEISGEEALPTFLDASTSGFFHSGERNF